MSKRLPIAQEKARLDRMRYEAAMAEKRAWQATMAERDRRAAIHRLAMAAINADPVLKEMWDRAEAEAESPSIDPR
jgi:hypothetical protein